LEDFKVEAVRSRAGKYFSVLLVISTLTACAGFFGYSDPPLDKDWKVLRSADPEQEAVTVRFSGTSTLLFSDGETTWMTDGWFSRPGGFSLIFDRVKPDEDAIKDGLAFNGVETMAAVIPLHSHYDHAMDTAAVAQLTGATIYGDQTTRNICDGSKLKGEPGFTFEYVKDNNPLVLEGFKITFIESGHYIYESDYMVKKLIDTPAEDKTLETPASPFAYKQGEVWLLYVEHKLGSFMVVGSAGYKPGQLEELTRDWPEEKRVDVLFLGIGGLGAKNDGYRKAFWNETVLPVRPRVIVPIHWDSLTSPIDDELKGTSRVLSLITGGEEATLEFLKDRQCTVPGLSYRIVRRYDPVAVLPVDGKSEPEISCPNTAQES